MTIGRAPDSPPRRLGRRGYDPAGATLSAVALVAVVLAAGTVRAAPPLLPAHVYQDSLGELNTDFTMAGWVFTQDGGHVYVAGGNTADTAGLVAHFTVDAISGLLTFADAVSDPYGEPVVFGGLGGAMQLGPGEAELYYASLGSLGVFRRDAASGALTLLQAMEFPGFGSDAVAVTPDGLHVLVAANDRIVVYPRAGDGTVGAPLLVPTTDRDAGDIYTYPVVAALAVSADGLFVYALQTEPDGDRDAVLILRRDPGTGALTRLQRVGDGFDDWVSLGSLAALAASPDGRDLFAGIDIPGTGGVVALRLDATGGRVVQARVAGRPGPASRVITVSPDGALVLTGDGPFVGVWQRDPETGDLELVQTLRDGDAGGDAIDYVDSIAVGPDGRFVYVLASQDHAVTVFRRRCGDGVIDAEEACDDGDFVSRDGCDAACRVEPCWQCGGAPSACGPAAGPCDDGDPCTLGDTCLGDGCGGIPAPDGAACDDGNACTTGETCRAGACVPEGRISCGPCGVCDRELAACVGMVARGCQRPPETLIGNRDVRPGRLPVGRFSPKKGAAGLRVRWSTTDPLALEGLGDPTATTSYHVCLLDVSGLDDFFPVERQRRRIVAEAHVPSAAECGAAACWQRSDAATVYRRRSGKPDGIRQLRFASNPDGGLDLAVTGRGRAFRLGPKRPIAAPLTVQILTDGGACWQGDLELPKRGRGGR